MLLETAKLICPATLADITDVVRAVGMGRLTMAEAVSVVAARDAATRQQEIDAATDGMALRRAAKCSWGKFNA